jgi:hypothetical protein
MTNLNPEKTIKTFPDVPSSMVSMRITDTEKLALAELAQANGYLYVSDFMRALLLAVYGDALQAIIQTIEVKK